MKRLCVILLLFAAVLNVSAQQGEYVRKSVTSLDSVWFKPGSLHIDFDMDVFNKFIDFYIEVERFDYNNIPSAYAEAFRTRANNLSTVTSTALAEVLEQTVVDKILEILNDPEIQKARGAELKSEASAKSFAATKAKSFGLTAEELEVLLNSAYIYLPFITGAVGSTTEDGDIKVDISGGIIWWKIDVNEDGSAEVREILSETTTGMSQRDPDNVPDTFSFGDESWQVSPSRYVQNDAMLAFAKNLGVKTKNIDAFKLTGQIVEVLRARVYGFAMGSLEGVHLDDGFDIIEYMENEDGEVVAVNKGFARVIKTGKNDDDPAEYSYARQIIGSRVAEGAVLIERPRLGVDLRIGAGVVAGSDIKEEHTSYILNSDASTQVGANAVFAYNLAPIIGVSQTFAVLDTGVALPLASQSIFQNYFVSVLSAYLGMSKNFGGRLYIGGAATAGVDGLLFTYVGLDPDYEETLILYCPGVKLEGEVGYMVNPDLRVYGSVGYKHGFRPIWATHKINGVEQNLLVLDPEFDDLQLGGISITLGVNYALAELPVNIFGWLDPYKRY